MTMASSSSGTRSEPRRARADEKYSGVRLDVQAELAGARLPMRVDVGWRPGRRVNAVAAFRLLLLTGCRLREIQTLQ